ESKPLSATPQAVIAAMRIRARHYLVGETVDLLVDRGRITSIKPAGPQPADVSAGWIAPPLFDLQINGCDGISFSSTKLTIDNIRHVASVCANHGIGGFCPTLITNSFEALNHGFRVVAKACGDRDLNQAMPRFHLEGPYISPEDGPRGAHPKEFVRKPDWDEFRRWQDSAGGRIKLVTLAPELEGALSFIEKLAESAIVVSIGHTAASRMQIRDAVSAGAKLSTHLGNGSHAVLPRHDNYIWEQLAAEELWASVICDG